MQGKYRSNERSGHISGASFNTSMRMNMMKNPTRLPSYTSSSVDDAVWWTNDSSPTHVATGTYKNDDYCDDCDGIRTLQSKNYEDHR